jgi:hypothetical protein
MNDPFDDLRDHLVQAITRLQTSSARTSRWSRIRSHPLAAVVAGLVFAGTASAAVISITSERSAPLAGQVPRQAGPSSPHFWGLEGGEHYRITVWPVLQGGVSGVCVMIVFEGPHGVGYGSCGAPYPTTSMPYLAPGDRTAYPKGIITKGGALEYFLTGPRVAAVRIGAHLAVTPRREPGLPAGDRAVVFYLPAGSPEIDPPWFPAGQLGLPRGAKTLSVVAVGRNGAPIPVNRNAQQFRLPARFWEQPEKPPSGACALAAPPGYSSSACAGDGRRRCRAHLLPERGLRGCRHDAHSGRARQRQVAGECAARPFRGLAAGWPCRPGEPRRRRRATHELADRVHRTARRICMDRRGGGPRAHSADPGGPRSQSRADRGNCRAPLGWLTAGLAQDDGPADHAGRRGARASQIRSSRHSCRDGRRRCLHPAVSARGGTSVAVPDATHVGR